MLSAYIFTKVPSFFLHGYKTPSKRDPWKSYINLVSTIWVLSYEEARLGERSIEIFDFTEDTKKEIEFENIVGFEKFLKLNTQKIKAKKLRILNFKIHSESEDNLWHYVSIASVEKKLKPSTPISVYCDCEDFRYTFSYVLYHYKALLFDNEFPEIFKTVPPKKRNPYQIPWACKHVFTIVNFLLRIPNVEFSEEFVLKYNAKNIPHARPRFSVIEKIQKLRKQLLKEFKRYIKSLRITTTFKRR